MAFNQNANQHYEIGPAYPPYQCYQFNPSFGDGPPPGLHVAPRAQPPPMNQEPMNWPNTYNYPPYDYRYNGAPSHPQMWPSSTYGTSHMGQPSLPPPPPPLPPNVARPTLHRDPWHNIEANCDAFFGEPRATRRKSRQSKSKPGTVNIQITTAPKRRNGEEAPQSHEPIHGQTEERPIGRRPQTNLGALDDDTAPSPVGYRGGRSHMLPDRRRQPPQCHAEDVEDYEGDYEADYEVEFEEDHADSSPATPRQEFHQPSRARPESMPPTMHPTSSERPFPDPARANRPRYSAGATANMTRLRNEVGNTHGNAGLSRQGGPMMPSGREIPNNRPTVPEVPRNGYGNPRNQGGQRGMTTEEHMRAALEHMHATDPYVYQEPPRGVNADDHLVARREPTLGQYRQNREGSSIARSRVSTDDGSAAILISVLDMVRMHLETRSREASLASASGLRN